jgi:PASTA domain
MADEQQPPDRPRDSAAGPDRSGADETREMPPVAAGDETEPTPGAGDTEVLPSVPRWSGRAGVPPPDALVVREAVPGEEDAGDDRRWWLPVVLALVALALLALLGAGLWLVLRGNDDSAPVSPVTPALTASATLAEPSPSTPSPAPTTPPSPTERAQVVVPRLVGIDSDTAQSILDRLGLTTRLTSRPDPVAQPGTVLEVDPAEGSVVPAGTRVTLVIASAPPSPTPPSAVVPTPLLPSPTLSR